MAWVDWGGLEWEVLGQMGRVVGEWRGSGSGGLVWDQVGSVWERSSSVPTRRTLSPL